MDKEITVEKLTSLMDSKGMKQKDLVDILKLTPQKVSQMMNKVRKISNSEQKLLKLYFYGIMPFEMLAPIKGYDLSLGFDKNEWRVLGIIARRNGYKDTTKWIVQHIREYLAYLESRKTGKQDESPNITPLQDVAEDEVDYKVKKRFAYHGSMAAGQPVESQIDDFIEVDSHLSPDNHIILEVCGDSASPDFNDGEKWFICTDKRGYTAKKDTPAVFEDADGLYLKVYQGGDKPFRSVNPDHPDRHAGESLSLVGYPVEEV